VKLTVVALLLVAYASAALADEPSYRATIDAAHRRLNDLNRKLMREHGLPPNEETERFALIGRLTTEDPVWALSRQIPADISALGSGRTPTAEEATEITDLHELQAIVDEFSRRATTLSEARAFASILRQFVVRRDVDGAKAWARAQ
jgi:hypothetical protein